MRTAQAPTSVEGGSVPVTDGFRVTDIMEVDYVNQQIEVDLVMRVAWTAPRLADLQGSRVGVTEIWTPQIRLVNSSHMRVAFRNTQNQVSISEGGLVTYVQRGTGCI